MSGTPDPKLTRYLQGYLGGNDVQEPPGPDGDPQLAALDQFLQSHSCSLGADAAVLDVGSGRGIAAHRMLRIWTDDQTRPWYYAVDTETGIDALTLPRAIHNRSRKFGVDALLQTLSSEFQNVSIVLLRNVLHHLHIAETASMLTTFRHLARAGAVIYLQDLVFLPEGERVNTGWPPEILKELLKKLGFRCSYPVSQRSKSGTPWYTFILTDNAEAAVLGGVPAAELVLRAREEQYRLRIDELSALDDSEQTLAQYVVLADEVASLGVQIANYSKAAGFGTRGTSIAGIPVRAIAGSGFDYAEEMASANPVSGLRAILSSKRLIDLPALIASSHTRLWFMGYSQRILFSGGEMRDAVKAAVVRGVDVRILLAHPGSPAVQARGASAAYASPEQLVSDIVETEASFFQFRRELEQFSSGERTSKEIALRFCRMVMPASFFIADESCIFSLYSSTLTGGDGAAFVFRSGSPQVNDYFHVLLREFQGAWAASESPKG